MSTTATESVTAERPFRAIVRKNYEYLCRELRVSNYLDALYEVKVLSRQDLDSLLGNELNNYEQTSNFMDILLHKPEESIKMFFEIVRTRTDAQPHIYRELFSHKQQQDGTSQQEDTTDVAASKLYASSGSQQAELPKMDSQREELVPARLSTAMTASLSPTLLLDHLRLCGVLTAEEHRQLQQRSLNEKDQLQRLLHILPAKGKGSLADFCEVLAHVEGQEHLLKAETGVKLLGEETGVKVGGQSHRCQGSNSAASTDCLSPETEHMGCEQEMSSIPVENVPTTLRKQDQSCLPSKARQENFATFFFQPEHRKLIKPIENIIALMCAECFGMERSMVVFLSAEMADIKKMLGSWGHTCFVDLDSAVAVLCVHGSRHDRGRSHISVLESLIVTHLQMVNPHLELPPGECSVLEVMPSSSFIC